MNLQTIGFRNLLESTQYLAVVLKDHGFFRGLCCFLLPIINVYIDIWERNSWSFNTTTRSWVNSSKFWKPIVCRFLWWDLILFQWSLDTRISLLFNIILRSSNWSVRPWSEKLKLFFELGPQQQQQQQPPHSLYPSMACSSSFLHFIPLLVFITASCLSKIKRSSAPFPCLCYFPGKNPLPSIEEIKSLYTRFRKYIAMNTTLQW